MALTARCQDFTLDLTHRTGFPQNLPLPVPPTVDVLVDFDDVDGFVRYHGQFFVVAVASMVHRCAAHPT